jgi:antitoxin component of MazEF toxin-antitoxin module
MKKMGLSPAPPCAYSGYMKTMELKLSRMGNSRGVRLPAGLISRYGFGGGMAAEVREEGLLLKPSRPGKLSWAETAREMAASGENWDEWTNMTDGLEECPWDDLDSVPQPKIGQKTAPQPASAKTSGPKSPKR